MYLYFLIKQYDLLRFIKSFFTIVNPLHLSEVDACSDEYFSLMVPMDENSYDILNDGDQDTCLEVSWIYEFDTTICFCFVALNAN